MWCASDALIHCCLHRNMPKACPYVMMRFLFALSDNVKYWFFAEGERFLFQSPQYLSTEPVRASERVGYDCEEGGRSIPLPTLSEAHIVCTLLSPSYASLHARTLAWCFASFGISDACSCRCFSFPIVFPLSRNLCPRLLWLT